MNHFILDDDLAKSAQYHCDSHCIKIILEMTQVASTVNTILGFWAPYKPTHKNHPITVWARESRDNFDWICEYGLALCQEYFHRYGKIHKCQAYLEKMLGAQNSLKYTGLTEFCQCMPENCKNSDVVQAYRNYYIIEKSKSIKLTWKNREKPSWMSS